MPLMYDDAGFTRFVAMLRRTKTGEPLIKRVQDREVIQTAALTDSADMSHDAGSPLLRRCTASGTRNSSSPDPAAVFSVVF